MSEFELAVVAVFGFLIFLRIVVGLAFAHMIIRPVRRCPACFQPTVSIRPRWLVILPSRYEWRWCPHCRWEGPGRRGSGPPPPARPDRPLEASLYGS